MKLLVTFIIVSAINVIFSTTRQILTVNGGKWVAALACAIYNAFNGAPDGSRNHIRRVEICYSSR